MKGKEMKLKLKRGDVIIYNIHGKEYKGVIVCNNKCAEFSSVFQVVPIVKYTNKSTIELSNGKFLDFSNEFLLDKKFVINKLGYLNKQEYKLLDKGIILQHGIGDYNKPEQPIKKGDVFMAELPKIKGSSVQSGFRPVIVVTNNNLMDEEKIQIVTCTTQIKNELPTHFKVQMKELTTILCETEMSIKKSQLRMKVGSLGEKGLKKLDKCICIQHQINN